MGPFKLADTLDISIEEAKTLIKKYFKAFPSIKNFLDRLGEYGKQYGYIKTFTPYRRIRWFTNWWPNIVNSDQKRELGSIDRASRNTPIQGTSADMVKKALILIREAINKYDLNVKLVMTVHDQIDTICEENEVEYWSAALQDFMEIAAKEVITNGLLKAEVTISNCWEK